MAGYCTASHGIINSFSLTHLISRTGCSVLLCSRRHACFWYMRSKSVLLMDLTVSLSVGTSLQCLSLGCWPMTWSMLWNHFTRNVVNQCDIILNLSIRKIVCVKTIKFKVRGVSVEERERRSNGQISGCFFPAGLWNGNKLRAITYIISAKLIRYCMINLYTSKN
mgnify:CR=1 FL=1